MISASLSIDRPQNLQHGSLQSSDVISTQCVIVTIYRSIATMQRVGRTVFQAFKADAAVTSALFRGKTMSVAASVEPSDVPAGHRNSDLNAHVCNIGLNRRR